MHYSSINHAPSKHPCTAAHGHGRRHDGETRATKLPTSHVKKSTHRHAAACYREALLLLDDISHFRDTESDVMRHGSRCRRALSRATNEHGHGPLVFLSQAIAQIWTLKCMRFLWSAEGLEVTMWKGRSLDFVAWVPAIPHSTHPQAVTRHLSNSLSAMPINFCATQRQHPSKKHCDMSRLGEY